MRKAQLAVVSAALVSLILMSTGINIAHAELNYSDCLLKASSNQVVSLGKPLATERLGTKSKVRIGVLPFYFTDGKVNQLTDTQKSDYLQAASRIKDLSLKKVNIEIVFLPSFNSGITRAELKRIYKMNDTSSWDLDKRTWGFVKKTIIDADKTIDFTNLDSVLLEGNNDDGSYSIAEAIMFLRQMPAEGYDGAKFDFFKSISTQDGVIDNAVLFDHHQGIATIEHEILHNFGLTDLYGSGTGPGILSLMAGGALNVLNYEKAVLGWFPNENFICSPYTAVVDKNKVDNKITITNTKQDSILLLKLSSDKAYVIEIINEDGKSLLLLYLLEQEMRPPVTLYSDPNLNYLSVFDISNPLNTSSLYRNLDFVLLISNIEGTNLELTVIPKDLDSTKDALALFENSRIKKDNLISSRSAADKAAADKAAADKAAADKAAADKAAADKAAASKKISITCVKGKLTKTVTAVKPVCPTGYKKK